MRANPENVDDGKFKQRKLQWELIIFILITCLQKDWPDIHTTNFAEAIIKNQNRLKLVRNENKLWKLWGWAVQTQKIIVTINYIYLIICLQKKSPDICILSISLRP